MDCVIQALLTVGPIGDYPLTDWTIRVAPYAPNVASFIIMRNGIPFVNCYASYITDPDKAEAASRQILSELKTAADRLEVLPTLPFIASKLPPMRGPFLMVAFTPTILAAGDEMSMLGDAERCIYWHLHRYYGE